MNRRPTRSLVLKRESLTLLSNDDLTEVAVAAQALSRYDGKCTFDDTYLICTRSCYVAP